MEKTLLEVVVYHTARALSTLSQKFSGLYLAFFSLSRDIFGAARGGTSASLASLERRAQEELARMGSAGMQKMFRFKK